MPAGLVGTATILATLARRVPRRDRFRIAWYRANPHDGALSHAIQGPFMTTFLRTGHEA